MRNAIFMIDVFEKITPLLKFNSQDDFYYLQILQRKKENPQIGSNSRVIKNYYVSSVEYLENSYEEIKTLCKLFNARAALRLNKRSYTKVGFRAMQNIANSLANGEHAFIKKSYDRACGKSHNSCCSQTAFKRGRSLAYLNTFFKYTLNENTN